jgi:hypothetical protein
LFIGLGQLPNNKWGITPYDGDPKMHTLLQKHLGPSIHSCSCQADDFLKKAFYEEVKTEPLEYVRKCLTGLQLVVTSGVYAGEFFEPDEDFGFRNPAKEFAANPSKFIAVHGFGSWRFFLQAICLLSGRGLLLLSYLLLPVTVFYTINQKDLFLLVVFLGIVYQAAIGIFVFNLNIYASNMLLFHIINTGIGIVLIKNWWINSLQKRTQA